MSFYVQQKKCEKAFLDLRIGTYILRKNLLMFHIPYCFNYSNLFLIFLKIYFKPRFFFKKILLNSSKLNHILDFLNFNKFFLKKNILQ